MKLWRVIIGPPAKAGRVKGVSTRNGKPFMSQDIHEYDRTAWHVMAPDKETAWVMAENESHNKGRFYIEEIPSGITFTGE